MTETDVVERLKKAAASWREYSYVSLGAVINPVGLCDVAADEITRLRSQVAALRDHDTIMRTALLMIDRLTFSQAITDVIANVFNALASTEATGEETK